MITAHTQHPCTSLKSDTNAAALSVDRDIRDLGIVCYIGRALYRVWFSERDPCMSFVRRRGSVLSTMPRGLHRPDCLYCPVAAYRTTQTLGSISPNTWQRRLEPEDWHFLYTNRRFCWFTARVAPTFYHVGCAAHGAMALLPEEAFVQDMDRTTMPALSTLGEQNTSLAGEQQRDICDQHINTSVQGQYRW